MPAQTLLWETPVEVAASGNVGGLLHFYTEQAQVLYTTAAGELRTRVATVKGGAFPGATWGSALDIDGGRTVSGVRIDQPVFGQAFGAWVENGELVSVLYSYAADITDIITRCEITEQVDNTIRSLSLQVQNVAADMFESEYSLFSPGAAVEIGVTMGQSLDWYPMGRFFLDKSPFDPFDATQSMQGRSRAGRLLKDTTFDTYNSTTGAKFTGTAGQIVVAVLTRYSDGEITADEIAVESSAAINTVTFAPEQEVLVGLTDWLSGKETAGTESHDTLERGDTGDEVKLAQKLLNKTLPSTYTKLVVDGIFGPKTEAAVRYFQHMKKITETGDVDAATWAALLVKPVNWKLIEKPDGSFAAGSDKWLARYHRPVGRYPFKLGRDVLSRRIDRSIDGCYSRVGVKYKSGEADAYKYALVDMWPSWAVPSHKTLYLDAPDGASAAQAQTLADQRAVELQYVGVSEQVVGPLRPELQVGDIAQLDHDGITSTVTGLVTEVQHQFGSAGFMTSFVTDSGGAIMGEVIDEVEIEVLALGAAPGGTNRKRRISDLIKTIVDQKTKFRILTE